MALYKKAKEKWYKWRDGFSNDPVEGILLWEFEHIHYRFKLEAYYCRDSLNEVAIFKFYTDEIGGVFEIYKLHQKFK